MPGSAGIFRHMNIYGLNYSFEEHGSIALSYHQVSFEQTSEIYCVGGPSDDVLPSVSVNSSKSGAFISETNCAGHVGGVEKFVGSAQ